MHARTHRYTIAMCTHVLPAVLAPMWRNYALHTPNNSHQDMTDDEDGRITAYVSVTLFSLILMTLFNVYRFARADALTFSHAYSTYCIRPSGVCAIFMMVP